MWKNRRDLVSESHHWTTTYFFTIYVTKINPYVSFHKFCLRLPKFRSIPNQYFIFYQLELGLAIWIKTSNNGSVKDRSLVPSQVNHICNSPSREGTVHAHQSLLLPLFLPQFQHLASILKFASCSKIATGVPALTKAFQAAGGRKKE